MPKRGYPRVLRAVILASSLVHDFLVILVAYYSLQYIPPSVSESLGNAGLDMVWALMLAIGGICGIYGALRTQASIEVTGCVLMISGKVTWAVAAITQISVTPSTPAIAAMLAAGGFSTMWRMFGVMVGLYLRVRD